MDNVHCTAVQQASPHFKGGRMPPSSLLGGQTKGGGADAPSAKVFSISLGDTRHQGFEIVLLAKLLACLIQEAPASQILL